MSSFIRSASLVSGASLVLAPLALIGQPAFATGTCATTTPAATLIAPGVCEVAFTEAGSYTFTPPTGVTKISALLVAGGGGASYNVSGAYAGGGGEVAFVDALDLSGDIGIGVGAGGAAIDGNMADNGVPSAIEDNSNYYSANGGLGGFNAGAGTSGNGNDGFFDIYQDFGAGGGAGSAAADISSPGAGLAASAAGSGDLFPVISGEALFGAGGDSYDLTDGDPGPTAEVPGNGGNSRGYTSGENGMTGAVYLRFAVDGASSSTPKLANTGSNEFGAGFGITSVVAGLALIATARRRRTN